LPPSLATLVRSIANLTPAPGCQDHTTPPSAGSAARLAGRPRPPHPRLNVRDDAYAPLVRRDGEGLYTISENRKEEFSAMLRYSKHRIEAAGENFFERRRFLSPGCLSVQKIRTMVVQVKRTAGMPTSEASTIVLLPGMDGTGELLKPLAARLSARRPVVVVD
jgi:hypothetical protein